MTDRELLELAAKAAKMGPLDFDYAAREGHHFYMGPRLPMPQGVIMAAMYTYWNPLTDDGDSLRLAVALCIQVTPELNGSCNVQTIDGFVRTEAAHGSTGQATRRAIVRAAAEIGKSISNQQ